ncbi:VanZ family protein [Luteococcus japonicus]|uniref:VanZ family protein n=1 Tax=Luteococcus japonicus TaxID=33984 RepID=UPI0014761B1D|nr:VanZ family protein [Luteococcus japonicus]
MSGQGGAVLTNALNSLAAGALLSVVLLIPVVVWQYRRYGEIAEVRLGLIGALLVYCSALVAYTMFPLPDPSTLTDAWCARRVSFNPDPMDGVRRVARATQGLPHRQTLLDHTVLELVFNVVLFVPLGWFGRRILEWKVLTTLAVGVGVCLLIELTQYTGIYGIFPCAYRLADVVDLVTNTTGTVVGIALAMLFPRLFPTSDQLEADADRAREVDRGRRWLGQVLDAAYFVIALAAAGFGLALVMSAAGLATRQDPSRLWTVVMVAADLLALVFAVLSFTGDGSSLGQRTTFLRPVVRGSKRAPSGRRRLLRPFVTMVPVAVLVFGQPTGTGRLVGLAWAALAVLSILLSRRGLSGLALGLDYSDKRERPA